MVFGGDAGFPMIALNFFSFGNCLQLQIRGTNFSCKEITTVQLSRAAYKKTADSGISSNNVILSRCGRRPKLSPCH